MFDVGGFRTRGRIPSSTQRAADVDDHEILPDLGMGCGAGLAVVLSASDVDQLGFCIPVPGSRCGARRKGR